MHVRHDHAQHRQAVELVREDLVPCGARRVVGDATVDDGPAFAPVLPVAQQPEVDVVELKWQGHAQPEDTGRNFDPFADCRRMGTRKMQ